MNFDPLKYCRDCCRPKPREGFRAVGHGAYGQPVRFACADCYAKIRAKREQARKRVVA